MSDEMAALRAKVEELTKERDDASRTSEYWKSLALAIPNDSSALEARLAQERERCAKVCDEQMFNTNVLLSDPAQSSAAWQIRCAIREMK